MNKDKTTKHKCKEINLLFHVFILVLAIVIDLPNSINFLKTPAEVANYAMSRVFLLVVFYACYFVLVPNFLARKKILSFVVLLIALVNLVTMIGYSTLQLVHAIITETSFSLIYTWNMHFSGMFGMIMAAIFGTVLRTVTGWFDEMHKKSLLEQEKLRSELLLLKSQVNPHFLFNTLNTIDFLIYSDQHKASESLIKLSTLLRYVIYDTVNDLVPLQQEIEQMEAYIDLQRLRYDENAAVSYEKAGDPSGKMVAPMLFIPFIENAFKHTDEAGIKKGMNIRFHISGESIEFFCKNHISLNQKRLYGGFGLENVRKRLEMQYPRLYTLSINQDDQVYAVELKLNLQ